MKRSTEVALWMLGAGLGVAVLSDSKTTEPLRQDKYASREDCMQDWGGSPETCQEETSGSSGGSSSGGNGRIYYEGPRYYWDRSAGHPVIVTKSGAHQPMPSARPNGNRLSHSIGSVDAGSVSRGGFGHFSSLGRGG
jgi:hypothetical protein